MREWENYLNVEGWTSGYESVANLLSHYKRMTRSELTKAQVCDDLMALCKFAGKNPDKLTLLSPVEASKLVQRFIDGLRDRDQGIRTINVALAYLKMFFRVNGFKGEREVDVERHHQPARYRKRPEYIPTPQEIYKMAYSAGSARNKAMVLALYTSGLRNSTLRAVLYGDVRAELEKNGISRVVVSPEMKRIDEGACKGNIPYYTFFSKETVEAINAYLDERKQEYGTIMDNEPLFASTSTNVTPDVRRMTSSKKRALDELVKRAAKKAGIPKWKDVYPHCLRKAFEAALRNSGLDLKDQEFLIGHILPGTMDTYYNKTKTEELKLKYAKVRFFPENVYSEEARKRMMLDTARIYGYPDEKIKKIEDALAKYKHVDEALDEIRKLKLGINQKTNPRRQST